MYFAVHADQVKVRFPASNCMCPNDNGIECLADGTGPITFKWVDITSNTVFSNNEILRVGNSTSSYKCVASNVLKGKLYESHSPLVQFKTACCLGRHYFVK